jgi:hypothetical protein
MSPRCLFGATLALAFTFARPVVAQSDGAQSPLTVHGYLSQGYAKSDGEQLAGITKNGTTDYRTAAIQFSYASSSKDRFVLQFANRRLGASPAVVGESDVSLDWAFYAHQFDNGLTTRVGRIHIPLGIYNETRSVGVLLPFYRAPFAFYGDRDWTAEAVDGASVSKTLALGRDWSLDATAYGGGWNYNESLPTPVSYEIVQRTVRRGAGSQVWLNTPIQGLRIGGGNLYFEPENSSLEGDSTKVAHLRQWHAGIDGSFQRFKVQSEFREATWAIGKWRAGYVLLGVAPTSKLNLNVQGDFARVDLAYPNLPPMKDLDMNDDVAIGTNYRFTEALVAKFEYHFARSLQVQRPINYFGDAAPRARYLILSMSTAF